MLQCRCYGLAGSTRQQLHRRRGIRLRLHMLTSIDCHRCQLQAAMVHATAALAKAKVAMTARSAAAAAEKAAAAAAAAQPVVNVVLVTAEEAAQERASAVQAIAAEAAAAAAVAMRVAVGVPRAARAVARLAVGWKP